GAMSLAGSNGILGIRLCMMAPAEALISPMTCASPALATKSTPVTPAAPLLFSTSTGWPSSGDMRSPRLRPKMSAGPPAGKGTTSVRGLVGKADCASAAANGNDARPATAARRVILKAYSSHVLAPTVRKDERRGKWLRNLCQDDIAR